MKNIVFLLLFVLLAGCSYIAGDVIAPGPSTGTIYPEVSKELTNISKVVKGMSLAEVTAKMGEALIIGYENTSDNSGGTKAITVQSPFKEEALNVQGREYSVKYYFTRIRKADGIIADDELTPLIFEKNKLVGKGWDFLIKLKK
ncbi:MAG: DUF3192 domain-containing protein [Candidatus Omnitrophica bacterium]|nr:DUF3192 domain-containing protein [Candidatus Omnitrophota bacterium]